MQGSILEFGISIVYEPENCSPAVDIVIIHGLQGHPYKTWACNKVPTTSNSSAHPQTDASDRGKKKQKNVRHFSIFRRKKSSEKSALDTESDAGLAKDAKSNNDKSPSVFWPGDLLPKQCPESRILMYGYDTKITKYMTGPTNKNSVFSHSKDLLFALSRERKLNRPLIFVAHSLGGIVVKESLARSSESTNLELHNVADSTAAVVFLGTPHRGSPDLSALGEWARSFVSTLRMETTSAILDTLGLKNTDLERTQESFSRLWQRKDFRVKTFQEGLGLTGVNLGVLGNKVVPGYSSLIGDHREQAETIQANHMDMCRFTGADDPNYRKVAGELQSIYRSIVDLNAQNFRHKGREQPHALVYNTAFSAKISEEANEEEYTEAEKTCLQSLWFPHIDSGRQNHEHPVEQTCLWLFEHEAYRNWFSGRNRENHNGLLWLKGKPGAGKSILMKEAFRRATLGQSKSNYWTAAFFFNAKGDELERTPDGLFRSLLYQLLPRYGEELRKFSKIWSETGQSLREGRLRLMFHVVFALRAPKKTLIFIDALDECEANSIRSQAYFWREVTKSAYAAGVHLNVCLSSRHFPSITLSDCPEIVVEDHNRHDIATYVEQKFQLGIAAQEPQWHILRDKILSKSAGVFLWVALIMDEVLKKWEEGNGLPYLLKQLDVVPEELEALFSQMFLSLNVDARCLTLRFFQWAILAAKPLRLHEWHHVLAFISQPTPLSLREWRLSDGFTETDYQLERKIKNISKGLVEVKSIAEESQGEGLENMSVRAGAGSLDLEHGETRVVQVIHESVREFFLHNNGFYILDPSLEDDAIGNGHFSIMSTCLDYLNITELDALVMARNRAEQCGLTSSSFNSPRSEGSTNNTIVGFPSDSTPLPYSSHPFGIPQNYDQYRPMRPSPPKRQASADPMFTFALLKESYALAPGVNVAQWVATNQFAANQISLNESTCNSPTRLSFMGQSQVLEDHPALLSYATFELFTHAQLAEKEGTDPGPIIRRLEENDDWARWITLREDVPQGIALLDYISNLGLCTWASNIGGNSKATDRNSWSEAVTLFDIKNQCKAPRRRGSVASFGSAGSHTGTSIFTPDKSSHEDLRKEKQAKFTPEKPADENFRKQSQAKKGIVGVCALEIKAQSKAARNIFRKLANDFHIEIFGDKTIFNEDIKDWPLCDFLVSFYSDGFPLSKAIAYVQLRKPFCVNDLPMQQALLDRRLFLAILDKLEVPTPRRIEVSRDGGPNLRSAEFAKRLKEKAGLSLGLPGGIGSFVSPPKVDLIDDGNSIVVNGKKLTKPFVEKPVSGEDHSIIVYYHKKDGGGGRRLLKHALMSSEKDDTLSTPRSITDPDGSYIYEQFVSAEDSNIIKAYTVGPNFCHAETRKSPLVNGIVKRNPDSAKFRHITSLTYFEREIAARISIGFGQRVCGFEILRTGTGSYVVDVNGWSIVKGHEEHHEHTAEILRELFDEELLHSIHMGIWGLV